MGCIRYLKSEGESLYKLQILGNYNPERSRRTIVLSEPILSVIEGGVKFYLEVHNSYFKKIGLSTPHRVARFADTSTTFVIESITVFMTDLFEF